MTPPKKPINNAPKGSTTAQPAVVGRVLTDSPVVRKLSFTGSTAVGKQLMRQCADTVKKMSLELGGNAPLIVFDDANLDKAVQGAVISKFRNAGQTCVCSNRILVQSSVYDVFIEKFNKAVNELTVGHGLHGTFDQGPMINKAAISKVSELLDDAVQKGARVVCGGQEHELGQTFYQPTIIADVTNEMRVAREEIFGPVAPVFRFETEEEAIAMANDTEYGLAAYFYANDLNRVWRVSEGLEYGMVAVNEGVLSTEVAPFGGIKESGIGREGSRYGIDEYLEMKYTLLGGIN
jgi:succinate-semialdehyde dehydrogenase/glutarate-semialdehyde dehydrogenase